MITDETANVLGGFHHIMSRSMKVKTYKSVSE